MTDPDSGRNHSSRPLAILPAFALATATAFLGSCDKEPSAATTALGEPWHSPHFAAVNGHLDLGGTVFAYVDIDHDVESLAADGNRLLKMVDETSPGQIPPEIVGKLDFTVLADDLGLDNLVAVGLSSRKDGDRFLNKAMLYTPDGRDGLLKLLGGSAQPFMSPTMAPEDADLVVERDLNLKAAMEIGQRIAARFPGADAGFQQATQQKVMSLSMNVGDFLGKFSAKTIIIGRIDPQKKMQLPMVPIELPELDLLIALHNVPWLWEQIQQQMPPEAESPIAYSKGEGFEAYLAPDMMGHPRLRPQLYLDKKTSLILIATSAEFIQTCLAPGTTITSNADFKDATSGLPTQGNGLSYASADIVKTATDLLFSAAEIGSAMSGTGKDAEARLGIEVIKMFLPEQPAGVASVSVNLDDGVLFTSKTYSSHKTTFLSSANPTSLGILAAMVVPVANGVQKKAKSTQQIGNMRNVILGLRTYAADEGGSLPRNLRDPYPDYIDDESLFSDGRNGLPEELLYNAGLFSMYPDDLILIASPAPIDGKRIVGYLGGIVKEIPENQYQEEQRSTEKYLSER